MIFVTNTNTHTNINTNNNTIYKKYQVCWGGCFYNWLSGRGWLGKLPLGGWLVNRWSFFDVQFIDKRDDNHAVDRGHDDEDVAQVEWLLLCLGRTDRAPMQIDKCHLSWWQVIIIIWGAVQVGLALLWGWDIMAISIKQDPIYEWKLLRPHVVERRGAPWHRQWVLDGDEQVVV